MGVQETIVLYPAADSRDLGPQHVDIHLFPADVEGSAHALRASLPTPGPGGIGHSVFRHPIRTGLPITIAPGMIEIESTQHSILSLYCLGGSASILSEVAVSTIEVASAAPILLVGKSLYDNDLDPIDLFVNGLGAWLSLLRARARGKNEAFDKLLLKVPPFTLYAQGLLLAAKHQGFVPVDERSERYWRSYQVIHGALTAAMLNPDYPKQMPNFERMLSVN